MKNEKSFMLSSVFVMRICGVKSKFKTWRCCCWERAWRNTYLPFQLTSTSRTRKVLILHTLISDLTLFRSSQKFCSHKMTRATRLATFATLGTTLYLLIWFSILPMPLLDDQVKDEIMPVVSGNLGRLLIGTKHVSLRYPGGYWYHLARIRCTR